MVSTSVAEFLITNPYRDSPPTYTQLPDCWERGGFYPPYSQLCCPRCPAGGRRLGDRDAHPGCCCNPKLGPPLPNITHHASPSEQRSLRPELLQRKGTPEQKPGLRGWQGFEGERGPALADPSLCSLQMGTFPSSTGRALSYPQVVLGQRMPSAALLRQPSLRQPCAPL